MPIKQIEEWKEQWNNGDVTFVPELFKLVEDMTEAVDQWKEQMKRNQKYHIQVMKQLEAQNKALSEQLVKKELSQPRHFIIPKDNISQDFLKELESKMFSELGAPAKYFGNGETK
jgi:hypothetical protein